MSIQPDLAHAARRVRACNEQMPDELRLEVAPEWEALLAHIRGLSDYKARRVIEDWTETMERRLSLKLLHAPLGGAA